MNNEKRQNTKGGILIIGSTYPRNNEDHQVPWLRETVNRTAARGHRVHVLASSFKAGPETPIDGIPVYRFRYAPKNWETMTHDEGAPNKAGSLLSQFLGLLYLLSGTVKALRLARQNQYDMIHVHWPFPHGVMGWIAARLTGAKYIANCHGAELAMGRRTKWIASFLSFTLRHADGIICNSSHTREEIQKVSGCHATVIPYGSTVKIDPPDERPLYCKGTTIKLLSCGRLIERKGLDVLIRAIPNILRRHNVTLDITGNGDMREEWEQLTKELKLENIVTFHGFVSNEKLGQLYRDCDIYVHPSIYDSRGDTEGLGVVLIEALLNEKPVVASGVGGIVDIIHHLRTGILVKEKNQDELTAAIDFVISNPNLASALGKNGREYALWHFNWDRVIDTIEDTYQQIETAPIPKTAAELPLTPIVKPNAPVSKYKNVAVATALAIAVLAAVGISIASPDFLERLVDSIAHANYRQLAIGAGLYLAYRIVNSFGWGLTIKSLRRPINLPRSSKIWLISETLRWIPGQVWAYCGRVAQSKKLNLHPAFCAMSISLELVLTIIAWVSVAAIGITIWGANVDIAQYFDPSTLAISIATSIAIVSTLSLYLHKHRSGKLASKVKALATNLKTALSCKPSLTGVAGVTLFYVSLCTLNGLAFWYIAQSLTNTPLPMAAIIGINAAGWVVGFLSFGAPGGIGAREATIIALLAPITSLEVCVAATIVWRGVQIAVEAGVLGIYLLPLGTKNPNTPTATPHALNETHTPDVHEHDIAA